MITWQNYLFQFIPEAIISVSVGVALFKYPYLRTLPKILFSAMIHASVLFLLWQLGFPTELRILLGMTILLLSIWIGFRFSAIQAIIFTLSASFLAVITEYLNAYFVYLLFGLEYQTVLQDPKLRLYVPYTYFALMAFITFIVYKSKLKLTEAMFQGRGSFMAFLGILGVAQVAMLILFSFQLQFLKENNEPLFSIQGIPLYILLILVLVIFSLSIIRKWYLHDIKKVVAITEDIYQDELQNLITLMRSNHHDIYNHIQVIHGLHSIEAYDEARKYLNQVVQEITITNLTIKIDNKALSILFHSKLMIAQTQNIELKLHVQPDRYDLIPSIDQIRIFSNIIDNAFEASMKLPVEQRKVTIRLESENDFYVFQVVNPGPTIPNIERIFDVGYSTKSQESTTKRGSGLSIVQQMVKKYNGQIQVASHENATSFEISLPCTKKKEAVI